MRFQRAFGHRGQRDARRGRVWAADCFATRAPNLLSATTSSEQIVAFNTCFDFPPIPCPAAQGRVISVDQNGMPGMGDSFHPTLGGGVFGKVAFTSQASLITGVTGQQVYGTNVCFPCAVPAITPGTTPVVLVSADSSGTPMGGDYPALDIAGQFATFSSAGSGSTSGPTQIFLAAPL